ncbi:hypothetical protein [Corynebacterium sp.]|uniref:hypothetical protein n=1 Tax=Corynebacterium sp. TaxID=1720 RepID=UPI0027B8C153|nr:hypothetical protein [Corynebacterium sp.]
MTALDSATYVVPDHGFGVIHYLPIEDVSPEVFSELLESTAAEGGYFSAELSPRTAQEGFAVRIGDSLLGRLSAADSQAYALFDWVLSAGLRPRATAHVSMTDASGEEWPTLNLLLPAPHLCIPANNPPAQRWTMLPGEAAATLTEFSKDVTGFPHTDEHYLVSLRTRGFLRRNTVDVYVNSIFLGSLPRDAAREIAPAVLDCTKSGRLAIAHGYFHYNADDRPALTIYAHNAANRHHAGLVLGVVAGGAAVMSAATAARAQAATSVPSGPSAAATSSTSGFGITSAASAAGASGAVTSNLLAAAGVAVLVGGGATVATHMLSKDEALSDTHSHSTAPVPESTHSTDDSSHFDGNGPKHPATPRLHDADPTRGVTAPSRATSSTQLPLADAPSKAPPHHRHASTPQPSKQARPTHTPQTDRATTPAVGHHDKHRGEHQGHASQAISRAASAATAAAAAAANNVESTPASTPAAAPSSSSEPAPQLAAKEPTATSTSSSSAEPSRTTQTTEPAQTTTSTDKQTPLPEPESSEPTPAEPTAPTTTSSLLTSEPQAESAPDSTAPSTTIPGSELEPTPEPEPTAPTTTIPGSEIVPTPEPEPEVEPAPPTADRSTLDAPEVPLVPLEPGEPEEPEETQQPETPGRPEEPEEQTPPSKVIVVVVEK